MDEKSKYNTVIFRLRKAYDIIDEIYNDAVELHYPNGKALDEAKSYLKGVITKARIDRDGK